MSSEISVKTENICLYYSLLLDMACLSISPSFHFKNVAYSLRCLDAKETLGRSKNRVDSQILPPHAIFFNYVGKLDGLDIKIRLLLPRIINLTSGTYNYNWHTHMFHMYRETEYNQFSFRKEWDFCEHRLRGL